MSDTDAHYDVRERMGDPAHTSVDDVIELVLKRARDSVPRALRRRIQPGLLRPIVDSRSDGIAELPSSQHGLNKLAAAKIFDRAQFYFHSNCRLVRSRA